MNPSTDQPLLPPPPPHLQLIPPPQPPQPHRSSFSCDRHPSEQYTGFCPTCLCERLTTLDHSSASSSSRRPSNATANSSTTAAALKAIFRIPSAADGNGGLIRSRNKPSSSSSFLPELRRTKSFSASKNEGFSGVFEPQRRSCDVRGRSTLWNLFNQDDVRKSTSRNDQIVDGTAAGSVNGPVLESKEEENDDNSDGDEIRVLEETNVINVVVDVEQPEPEPEPVVVKEEEEEIVSIDQVEEEEIKTMKDHIDLDSQAKKPSGMDLKEIAGTVWAAASVFSKKWNKWRHKQKKLKKHNADVSSVALPVEKPISRQFHETQSEIADYGFGRRSCDTDPRFSLDAGRFSLDAGRMSFEDPRYSFDEPRASWDGYLIGRTFPRLPPILSVVEDPPVVHISRSDSQIPVEEVEEEEEAIHETVTETVPGGTAQTRDYYCDSSRRRKSLDRSNSIRKTAAAVVAEIDEMEMKTTASNAKVSPTTLDYIPGNNHRDSNSNSSETFELGFNGEQQHQHQQQKALKKSRRWMKSWNIWGFIHRKNNNNNNNNNKEEFNGVQRSFSETWPDQRGFNPRVLRSNSSVSSRNSYNMGLFGSMRKHQQHQGSSSSLFEGNLNSNGHGKKKKKEEFVLERNRSARYSPNDAADNGLLRFYLTPMRSSSGRRGPSKLNNSHSIVRNVLRLY